MTDTSNEPTHVDGARRAEDIKDHDGEEAASINQGETTGANRPAGGRAAFDPMRVGQDEEGMRERGTVDPGQPDPSGGPQ